MKKYLLLFIVLIIMKMGECQVRPGAECMSHYLPLLKDKKVAVCGNQTSVVGTTSLVDTLLAKHVKVLKIFCPEHGFRGNAEAGASIKSSVDTKTGLPIISLYGQTKKPTVEQLKNIDIILFDLQDVGCRFYTYISTLHYVMEAAAENNIEVIVLDRPNPNGYFIDGPVLDPKFKSFVGMDPVPVVYGMTIGEYARMINGEHWLPNNLQCKLKVIKIENYSHSTHYKLPVQPSPNLPTPEAVYLYPSLCLFEGTAISVGRGTSLPFQIYGAPGIKVGDYPFTPISIKGVAENPPYMNTKCQGFNLTDFAKEHLNGENHFEIKYLITAYKIYPDKAKFFTSEKTFDQLAGSDQLRKQIIAGMSAADIKNSWQKDLLKFKNIRKKYLLYK